MTRTVSLNALKAGISRLRTKGGPDPQTLYDLVDGYVTAAGTIEQRPGFDDDALLPEGTVGLMSFRGFKYVFADAPIDLSGFDEYRLAILTHPRAGEVDAPALLRIHFGEPFMRYPYVSAEWDNGDVFHYWMQGEGEETYWQADTTYRLYAVVHPTVQTGFTYRAHRLGERGEVWAANVERAVDDVVEPTEENGFEYVAIEAYGSPPRSGATEPDWPTEEGAIVVEEADLAPGAPSGGGGGGGSTLPPDVTDRYGRGGSGGSVTINRQVLQ